MGIAPLLHVVLVHHVNHSGVNPRGRLAVQVHGTGIESHPLIRDGPDVLLEEWEGGGSAAQCGYAVLMAQAETINTRATMLPGR